MCIIKMYTKLAKTNESKFIGKQLMLNRSSGLVAANNRAAYKVRSKAEFFAKMSIMKEKDDEPMARLQNLKKAKIICSSRVSGLKSKMLEILSSFAKARRSTPKSHIHSLPCRLY